MIAMNNTSYEAVHLESIENDNLKDEEASNRIKSKASSIFSTIRSKTTSPAKRPVSWQETSWSFQDSYHALVPLWEATKIFLREAHWRHILRVSGLQTFLWFVLAGWLYLFVWILKNLTLSGEADSSSYGGCSPAGDWIPPYSDGFNSWDVSAMFQITVGFGSLSFSTAKFIDVTWDVVIGRGGQGFLAWISYLVFSKSLIRFMENSPVSYGTFEALTFNTAGLLTIIRLMKNYYTNATIRAKFAIFWIIVASIWVAAFPTFASAMSGYSPNIRAFVTDSEGSLVPWQDFKYVYYVIHDGWRLPGLEGEHQVLSSVVGTNFYTAYDSFQMCRYAMDTTTGQLDTHKSNLGEKDCAFSFKVANYTKEYGNGPSPFNSSFNDTRTGEIIELPAPTLNISIFYLPDYYDVPYTNQTLYPNGSTSGFAPTLDNTHTRWAHGNLNVTYDWYYIARNGYCSQQQNYKWGFSFLLLFIFCLCQAIWFMGMYTLYMDAYMESRFERAGRNMGTHRAALDFSKAIRKDMGEDATEEHVGETELRRRVRRKLNGGVIQLDMPDHKTLPVSRAEELRIWWRMNGGWRGRVELVKAWSFRKKFWVSFAIICGLVTFITPIAMASKSGYPY
ncbi:MAG: hypothetical protein Q9160_006560 [Pyrenula sp. 1 TL-2023]